MVRERDRERHGHDRAWSAARGVRLVAVASLGFPAVVEAARGTEPLGAEPSSRIAEGEMEDRPSFAWLSPAGSPEGFTDSARRSARAHMGPLAVRLLECETQEIALDGVTRAAREVVERHGVRGVFFVLVEPGSLAGGSSTLYLYDGSTGELFTQRVGVEGDSAEAAVEAIGVIAGTTAQSLATGAAIGMERLVVASSSSEPRTPSPAAAPSVPVPPRPSAEVREAMERQPVAEVREREREARRVRGQARRKARAASWQSLRERVRRYETGFGGLFVGYRGGYLAPQVAWHSGALLQAQLTLPSGLAVHAGYTVWTPVKAEKSPNTIELRRHPFELGVAVRLPLGARFVVRPEFTAIVDYVARSSRTTDPSLISSAPEGHWLFGVGPGLALGVDLGRYAGLEAGVRAEAWIRNRIYGVAAPEAETLIAPAVVRPVVWLGLAAAFPGLARKSSSRPAAGSSRAGGPGPRRASR